MVDLAWSTDRLSGREKYLPDHTANIFSSIMLKKKKRKPKKNHDQEWRGSQTPQGQANQPSPSPSRNSLDCKKRKRPRSSEEDVPKNHVTSIALHVIQWLEKRKMKIPDALRNGEGGGSSFDDVDRILCLLPSLRERERRALVRHVKKCNNINRGGDGGNSDQKVELEGSDGEYDIHDVEGRSSADIQSGSWPADVEFSNDYRWDPTVPEETRDKYRPPNATRPRAPRQSKSVYFKRITNPNHPAHGEFGLYCSLPGGAPPGSWLLDYVGRVMLGEDQDTRSDYVSDFGEKSELACDANSYGNESRFLNDFRNTGKHPNVEFNLRRDKNGELRQGVYVKQKKDAREEGFDGVKQHEELLVSYGKSYWRSRVGNLTDFVWRLPGKPMPPDGKPAAGRNGHCG